MDWSTMSRRIILTHILGISLVAVTLFRCGEAEEPSAPPPVEPPPNIQATVEAGVRQQLAAIAQLTPTPSTTPDVNQALVAGFNRESAAIAEEWDAFHEEYEAWRQSLTSGANCSEGATLSRLRGFAADFSSQVASGVSLLPTPPGSQAAAQALGEAAGKEELALRRLSATWEPRQPEGFLTYAAQRSEVDKLRRRASEALAEALEATVSEALEGFDSAVDKLRRQVSQVLAEASDSTPGEVLAEFDSAVKELREQVSQALVVEMHSASDVELVEFNSAVESINATWVDFRSDYDAWRRRDGECDTQAVDQALERFLEQFQATAQKTFSLPTSTVVRSLAQLLSEAADRELQALKTLRDTWKPYDRSYFTAFEAEVRAVGRLRRQVTGALEDLRLQYPLISENR